MPNRIAFAFEGPKPRVLRRSNHTESSEHPKGSENHDSAAQDPRTQGYEPVGLEPATASLPLQLLVEGRLPAAIVRHRRNVFRSRNMDPRGGRWRIRGWPRRLAQHSDGLRHTPWLRRHGDAPVAQAVVLADEVTLALVPALHVETVDAQERSTICVNI